MLLCPQIYPPIQQEQLDYQHYYRALVHVVGYIHYVQLFHFHFPYVRLPLVGSEVLHHHVQVSPSTRVPSFYRQSKVQVDWGWTAGRVVLALLQTPSPKWGPLCIQSSWLWWHCPLNFFGGDQRDKNSFCYLRPSWLQPFSASSPQGTLPLQSFSHHCPLQDSSSYYSSMIRHLYSDRSASLINFSSSMAHFGCCNFVRIPKILLGKCFCCCFFTFSLKSCWTLWPLHLKLYSFSFWIFFASFSHDASCFVSKVFSHSSSLIRPSACFAELSRPVVKNCHKYTLAACVLLVSLRLLLFRLVLTCAANVHWCWCVHQEKGSLKVLF